MTLAALTYAAQGAGLFICGTVHPDESAVLPKGTNTLVLLGPDGPRFWPRFSTSDEYADGRPDPMDRWSKRVISRLANQFEGTAIFPSDGPPYPPFITWALNSGAAWTSPVGLLVHAVSGLLVSFRGAIALPYHLSLPTARTSPCQACARPCETACPVGAMVPGQPYDVAACRAYVQADGRCRSGCLVRHACPVSKIDPRPPAQDAFHMAAFLGE